MSQGIMAIGCTSAPFLGFLLGLTVLRHHPRGAAGVNILACAGSLVLALVLLGQGSLAEPITAAWLEINGVSIAFGFLLDGQNLLMGVVVALICLLVQIYSLGYMAGDPGWTRYYAFMGFFAWSMLSFVYASNLLQMFIFWELVGLASFLLIGFWYEKPAASAAAQKAFLMTRVGDVGLFIGLILLFQATGTLEIARINDPAVLATLSSSQIILIALLMFSGVMGKSAQFPLHTWLPDAMEGPTPVSALLHSATMVAAGVFLFARFHPLFMADPAVPVIVLSIVAFTAILSATIAMVSRDIKRVLAYSSISQLSFMLIGLAAGSLFAGLFHLFTHAFFKALLFLCAGAYIHHFHTNDLVAIGRAGGRSMRWTTIGLVVGGAALAGLPPLAGFFSKEAIISAIGHSGFRFFTVVTYVAAFLTSYYTFRMIFLVTRPNPKGALEPEEPIPSPAATGGHESHATRRDDEVVMGGPILILTLLTLIAGFGGAWVAGMLTPAAGHGAHDATGHGGLHLADVLPALLVALAGVGLAWLEFGRRGASQLGWVARFPALQRLFVGKWYVDDFYRVVVGGLVSGVSRFSALFETRALDGAADGVAEGTVRGAASTARIQNGRLQFYIATAVLLVATFTYVIGRR
jgi:NADH-quinone oxidoreductase subunit L